jgi:hypothetical protein
MREDPAVGPYAALRPGWGWGRAVRREWGEDQRTGPGAVAIIFMHDHPGLERQQPETEQPGQHERADDHVAPG